MTTSSTTQKTTKEGRPYRLSKAIEAIKEAVPIADYAATLTELRGTNGTLRGRCPIHQGDSPDAFAVWPSEGRWRCFRCSEGGDIVDLCQSVEGGELHWAVVSLSQRYGVALPERPPQWFDWQDEKGKRRKEIRDAMADSYQRRLFKIFGGFLSDIEDAEEYEREAEAFFDSLRPVAFAAATTRVRDDA